MSGSHLQKLLEGDKRLLGQLRRTKKKLSESSRSERNPRLTAAPHLSARDDDERQRTVATGDLGLDCLKTLDHRDGVGQRLPFRGQTRVRPAPTTIDRKKDGLTPDPV